ncbi:MAG: hypothetical protein AAF694_12865 [Bacteroidota bacterium]
MNYTDLIKDKFPTDDRNNMFKAPNLPAVRLGKLLLKDRRINSPSDVLAMHEYGGLFSSGYVLITRESCYYPEGSFLLEDVKEFQNDGSRITIFVNQNAQLVPHKFSVKNEQVAKSLKRLFESVRTFDPKSDIQMKKVRDYSGYSTTELDWLNMRDEIMRTIDMLYDRYNDGKLTFIEYENKKEELLARL